MRSEKQKRNKKKNLEHNLRLQSDTIAFCL